MVWMSAKSMFRRSLFILGRGGLILLLTFSVANPVLAEDPPSTKEDWGKIILEILKTIAEGIAIPDAIAPLVTIAENADQLSLDALDIAIDRRRKQLLIENLDAELKGDDKKKNQIDKQLNSLEQIQAKKVDLKEKLNPPPKENAGDPFFARLISADPIHFPTLGNFSSLTFQLDTSAVDPDLQPFTYFVLPNAVGGGVVPNPIASMAVSATIHNDGDPANLRVNLTDLQLVTPNLSIDGIQTGINQTTLAFDLGPPVGRLRFPLDSTDVGLIDLRFFGNLTNDLYQSGGILGPPVPVFGRAQGALGLSSGTLTLVADDVSLVPGLPGGRPDLPMAAAASSIVYDSARQALMFEDMFTDPEVGLFGGLDPTFAFGRFNDNTYGTFDNSEDPLIGASLFIDDLLLDSISETSAVFSPSRIEVKSDQGTLLDAPVRNISLDFASGDFLGILDLSSPDAVVDATNSLLLQEIVAEPFQTVRFANPRDAGELVIMTEFFTMDGQSLRPNFVYVQAEIPEPATLLLFATGLVVLGVTMRQRNRIQTMKSDQPDK